MSIDWIKDQRIIDSHVHFTDSSKFHNIWLTQNQILFQNGKNWTKDELLQHSQGFKVEKFVFVEVDVLEEEAEGEAKWIEQMIDDDKKNNSSSAVAGLVAHAPLEQGAAVNEFLDRIAHQGLKGIRRLVQQEADIRFCLKPNFIEGIRQLASRNLAFDLGVIWPNLPAAVELCKQIPEVTFVLNHLGKPGIKSYVMQQGTKNKRTKIVHDQDSNENSAENNNNSSNHHNDNNANEQKSDEFSFDEYANHIHQFARLPNVVCKISGGATQADFDNWTIDHVRPFVALCIDEFGYDRCMFGSDWFVSTQATTYKRWIETVAQIVTEKNATQQQQDDLFYNTAKRVYRL